MSERKQTDDMSRPPEPRGDVKASIRYEKARFQDFDDEPMSDERLTDSRLTTLESCGFPDVVAEIRRLREEISAWNRVGQMPVGDYRNIEAERTKDREVMRAAVRTCCGTDAPDDKAQWCEGCKALTERLEAKP